MDNKEAEEALRAGFKIYNITWECTGGKPGDYWFLKDGEIYSTRDGYLGGDEILIDDVDWVIHHEEKKVIYFELENK